MASAAAVKDQIQRNRGDDVLLIADFECEVRHMQVGVIQEKSHEPLKCLRD